MISSSRLVYSRVSGIEILRSSIRHAHSAVETTGNAPNEIPAEELLTSDRMTAARSMLNRHTSTKKETQSRGPSSASRDGEGRIAGWMREAGERTSKSPNSRGKARYSNPLAKQDAIRPSVQSARVKDLAEQGKHEDAIDLVYKAPRATVNTATWNTLLGVLMAAGKRKEAYKVYIEMKRRCIPLSGHTFSTMMSGFAAITDWEDETNNFMRAEKIFEDYEHFLQKCIEKGDTDPKYIRPINSYIALLGRAGRFQKAIDVYYAIEKHKPIIADAITYGSLFDGLSQRKESDKKGELSISEQNASDAKFFWRRLEREADKGQLTVDSVLVQKFLFLLGGGRPADHQLGLEIIRDYCGLGAPGEDVPRPRVRMIQMLANSILDFCNKAKKHRLCLSFFKQVRDMKRSSVSTMGQFQLTRFAVNQVLIAQGHLVASSGSNDESTQAVELLKRLNDRIVMTRKQAGLDTITPVLTNDTIALALIVCWRCADWDAAREVLTTVFHKPLDELFKENDKEGLGVSLGSRVDFTAFSYLARTALLTNDTEAMRQFLHMATMAKLAFPSAPNSRYYRTQYSTAVVKMIELVRTKDDDMQEYEELLRSCKGWLARNPQQGHKHTPEHEENVFGSAIYVDKLSQAIDFEMATRSY